MAVFPEIQDSPSGLPTSVAAEWDLLAKIRGEALKALEAARNAKRINSGLEAKVIFELFTSEAEASLTGLLQKYARWIPALLIVSQVRVPAHFQGDLQMPILHGVTFRSEIIPGLGMRVIASEGAKCERCWNYSTHVGENSRYPTVCER